MFSDYCWIIDDVNRDFLPEEEIRTTGPSDWNESLHEMLVHTQYGQQFKMYDDDNEWYYTGRIVGEYEGLEPLEDYGMPNAGCTVLTFVNRLTQEESAVTG